MSEARECFAQVDATALDDEDSYTLNIGIDDDGERVEPDVSLTVGFEDFEADSGEELEQLLDEEAERVLEESEAEVQENVGYEIVREEGDNYRKCGFVVTAPHL